jgi:hypothetical protein
LYTRRKNLAHPANKIILEAKQRWEGRWIQPVLCKVLQELRALSRESPIYVLFKEIIWVDIFPQIARKE